MTSRRRETTELTPRQRRLFYKLISTREQHRQQRRQKSSSILPIAITSGLISGAYKVVQDLADIRKAKTVDEYLRLGPTLEGTGAYFLGASIAAGVVGSVALSVYKNLPNSDVIGQNIISGSKIVGSKALSSGIYVGSKAVAGSKIVGSKAVSGVKWAGPKLLSKTVQAGQYLRPKLSQISQRLIQKVSPTGGSIIESSQQHSQHKKRVLLPIPEHRSPPKRRSTRLSSRRNN